MKESMPKSVEEIPMLNRKRIVAFLSSILLLLVTGCSKEPPVEKETIKPPARQVSQVKKSKPAGLVGSSHQEETAQKQAANSEQPEASKPTAGSESMAKKANPTGASPAKEANPLPAKKGYRVAQASARGNVLSFLVPEDWKSVPAKSSMRLLQIALPGTSGPDSDGELSVFYFGPSAGTVQMNINRWIGQFSQPDGSSSKDKAKTEEIEGKHHSSTLLDLSGTMAPSTMPGMPAQAEKTNYRLLAAIVKTPAGPWFVKATGPEETMAHWREEFVAMIKSSRLGAETQTGAGGSGSAK